MKFKKILFAFLTIMLSFVCLSFKHINKNDYQHTLPETAINFDTTNELYDISLVKGSSLICNFIVDKNTNYKLIREQILDDVVLYGFINNKFVYNMSPSTYLSNLGAKKIKIDVDTSYGQKLYLIRQNALEEYTRKSTLAISTFSDSEPATTSDLAKITSNDSYIENYTYNTTQTLVKFDDDIVNIVPKNWFFTAGTKVYAGKEFLIYANTAKMPNNKLDVYETHVFILDYDFTMPEVTKDDLLEPDYITFGNSNFIIEPTLNHYFIGLKRSSAVHNDMWNQMNIDETKVEIVLNPANAGLFGSSLTAPNIYADVTDLTFGTETSQYNYDEIDALAVSFDTLKLECSISDKKINYLNQTLKFIYSITIDEFISILSAINPKIGIAVELINIGKEIYEIWQSNSNDENINELSYSGELSFREYFVNYKYPACVSASLPSNINSLISNNSIEYCYNYTLDYIFSNGDIVDYTKYLFNSYAICHLKLYNANKQIITYNNQDYYEAVLTNNDCRLSSIDSYETSSSLNFTSNYGRLHNVICYKPSIVNTVLIQVTTHGTPLDVNIYDSNGRCIALFETENNASGYMICTFKNSDYHFISVTFNNSAGGSCELKFGINSTFLTNNYKYTVGKGTSAKLFNLGSSTAKILNVKTESLNNTKFLIYNKYGAKTMTSDNPNADWSEDSPDTNASINIGLYPSTTVYVIVYSIDVYIDLNITMSLYTAQE